MLILCMVNQKFIYPGLSDRVFKMAFVIENGLSSSFRYMYSILNSPILECLKEGMKIALYLKPCHEFWF